MPALRIIFMGTPELARAILQALIACSDFQVIAVVTQPDRPKGRDLKLQASPVKELALHHHLPVLQPERARNEDFIKTLRGLPADLAAVGAYGQILPKSILDLPRFGCLNVHTSLLPKYRGAAPIQWAILNGEIETGVTIMKMDAGLDTGPILTQEKTPIHSEDTAQSLHDRLAQLGAQLLVRTIPDYVAGKIQPQPQPAEGASYAPKIKKQDGEIDWTKPARTIWNRVRGLVPWPGAFTHLRNQAEGPPHLLKIWQTEIADDSGRHGEILQADKGGIVVGCGRGSLRILVLQREGGRRLSAQEFLAGHPLQPGEFLRKL